MRAEEPGVLVAKIIGLGQSLRQADSVLTRAKLRGIAIGPKMRA